VSSQRRKSRKAHFGAGSTLRRKIMSVHLAKDLKTKYEVRSVPVRKGDTVKVVRGSSKTREGKVQAVYRKKWALHVEKVTKEKTNGKNPSLYHLISLIGTQV
jgi:large subunit ribosomal protein L26e